MLTFHRTGLLLRSVKVLTLIIARHMIRGHDVNIAVLAV